MKYIYRAGFPRLSSRGPIEVAIAVGNLITQEMAFPRLSSRGPIEVRTRAAAPYAFAPFPRLSSRGPIEVNHLGCGTNGQSVVSATIKSRPH